ncbi:MAG TPA: hypothetical protein DEA08_32755, partial [Planctomycetes bacterium]|nr:hypothetical protein [Planctomycetota bacterium]
GDSVRMNGARVGRVKQIRLFEDRQRVTLEVLPGVKLHSRGVRVEIVPTNALGIVAIDLDPGESDSAPLDPSQALEGRIRPAIGAGGGTPTPGRRKELADQLERLARQLDQLKDPDSGFVGSMLFDKEGRDQIHDGLRGLSKQWTGIADGLADFERRQATEGMLSRESLRIASETLVAFHTGARTLRDGVRKVRRGEGGPGRLLADTEVAQGLDEGLRNQAAFWNRTTKAEGTLGALAMTEFEGTQEVIDRIAAATRQGDQGQGFLGTLSSGESGSSIKSTLVGLEATLGRLSESDLVSGAKSREDAEDTLGNLDDFMLNLRRGLRGLRSGFPDKTFQGAVFAVF